MTPQQPTPAAFLDRDGTIIEEVGYIGSPDGVQLIPGAVDAIKSFRKMGYAIVVVSNQSGVARGYMSEEDVKEVNARVLELFMGEGAMIDAIYYCPHHPDSDADRYRIDCDCRKPKPGMILRATDEFNIDLSKSVMIGDKYTDVLVGKNLDLFSVLLLTGFGRKEYEKIVADRLNPIPDLVAADVLEAAKFIQQNLVNR